MRLAIVIVTYKTKPSDLASLLKSLRSLKLLKENNCQIIDNSKKNLGFAKAVNQGANLLQNQADWFLVLNPDVQIINLNISLIKQTAKHFSVFGGSFIQNKIKYFGGKIDYLTLAGGLVNKAPKQTYSACDFVSGSLMFVKKTVFQKLGGFCKKYFLYYEDVDFCYRARKAGYKIGINKNIFYEHYETSQNNPRKNYYLAKSHRLFFRRYSGWPQKIYSSFYQPVKRKIWKLL